MEAKKLTAKQAARLEEYKSKGVDAALIRRIETRFIQANDTPAAIKGYKPEPSRPVIQGLEG